MKQYEINEGVAKMAQELNCFNDYVNGSQTNNYISYLKQFDLEVDKLKEHAKKEITEEMEQQIEYWKDRYSKKLAYAFNRKNEIDAKMPSVMIAGPANFNVRAKEKQNNLRDKFWRENATLYDIDLNNYYFKKIHNILNNTTIYSNDEFAVDKLNEEITELKNKQEKMKLVNSYYRKNGTLDNCDILSENELKKIKYQMENYGYQNIPFASYELTNNNANIKRLESRLKELTRLKERTEETTTNTYEQVEGIEVKEDTTDMRIRLIFEEIPNAEIRELLKHNGFRWSPKNSAWQRQLTTNGIYATKQMLLKLKEIA